MDIWKYQDAYGNLASAGAFTSFPHKYLKDIVKGVPRG